MAIAGKMYSPRTKLEMTKIRGFLEKYNISDINVEVRQMAEMRPYRYDAIKYDMIAYDDYMNYTLLNVYKMNIPEPSFERIIERMTEFDNMLSDPETAELIQQARFLHRLKHGAES